MSDHDPDEGAAREDLCRFLAACYYEPGPEFAEEKLFDSLHDAARRLDPDFAACAKRLGEAFAASDRETLLVDYTRLFLGPVNALAKPYGSVWLSGEASLMQASSMAVVALYREGGFDIDESFRELPDHVAAELEFLYLLLFRENEAHRNADLDALMAMTSLRRQFLAEHLGAWIPAFTSAIEHAAQTAFYRELAALTRNFIGTEARRARDG